MPKINRTARAWILSFAFGWFAFFVLSAIWAMLIQPLAAENKVADLTIPAGTAASVSEGQPAKFIPAQLLLGTNRKLKVQNDDVVTHIVAGKPIPPHTAATIQADSGSQTITCTLHPDGYIGVGFDKAPGPLTVLFMATVLGLPTGLAVGGIIHVARKLDSGTPGGPTPVAI